MDSQPLVMIRVLKPLHRMKQGLLASAFYSGCRCVGRRLTHSRRRINEPTPNLQADRLDPQRPLAALVGGHLNAAKVRRHPLAGRMTADAF